MAPVEPLTSGELERAVLRVAGPTALDFYQASCPPCRVLAPQLERVARQYAGRVPVYRVDVDTDMAVAERFGVRSLPTVLVFRDGTEVERLDGLITEAQLRHAFDRASRACLPGHLTFQLSGRFTLGLGGATRSGRDRATLPHEEIGQGELWNNANRRHAARRRTRPRS